MENENVVAKPDYAVHYNGFWVTMILHPLVLRSADKNIIVILF